MLAIARALMSDPRLLLVDEASLGLSPVMTETAFDLIAATNAAAGVAVLIVEQNVLALDLAHRAFVLEKGQVVDVAEGDGRAHHAGPPARGIPGGRARDRRFLRASRSAPSFPSPWCSPGSPTGPEPTESTQKEVTR